MVAFTDETGIQVKAATTVPQHAGDIPAGTLRAIRWAWSQCGMWDGDLYIPCCC
jgi:hypothetical protein